MTTKRVCLLLAALFVVVSAASIVDDVEHDLEAVQTAHAQFEQLKDAKVAASRPPSHWRKQADSLCSAMYSWGTDEERVAKIILNPAVDIIALTAQFSLTKCGKKKSLRRWLEDETSGAFEQQLLRRTLLIPAAYELTSKQVRDADMLCTSMKGWSSGKDRENLAAILENPRTSYDDLQLSALYFQSRTPCAGETSLLGWVRSETRCNVEDHLTRLLTDRAYHDEKKREALLFEQTSTESALKDDSEIVATNNALSEDEKYSMFQQCGRGIVAGAKWSYNNWKNLFLAVGRGIKFAITHPLGAMRAIGCFARSVVKGAVNLFKKGIKWVGDGLSEMWDSHKQVCRNRPWYVCAVSSLRFTPPGIFISLFSRAMSSIFVFFGRLYQKHWAVLTPGQKVKAACAVATVIGIEFVLVPMTIKFLAVRIWKLIKKIAVLLAKLLKAPIKAVVGRVKVYTKKVRDFIAGKFSKSKKGAAASKSAKSSSSSSGKSIASTSADDAAKSSSSSSSAVAKETTSKTATKSSSSSSSSSASSSSKSAAAVSDDAATAGGKSTSTSKAAAVTSEASAKVTTKTVSTSEVRHLYKQMHGLTEYSNKFYKTKDGWKVGSGMPGMKANTFVSSEKVFKMCPSCKSVNFNPKLGRWMRTDGGGMIKGEAAERLIRMQVRHTKTQISNALTTLKAQQAALVNTNPKAFYLRVGKDGSRQWHATKYAESLGFRNGQFVKATDVTQFCPTCKAYYFDPKLKVGSQWRNAVTGRTAKVVEAEKYVTRYTSSVNQKVRVLEKTLDKATSKITSTTTKTTTASSSSSKAASSVAAATSKTNPKAFYLRVGKDGSRNWKASEYAVELGFKKGQSVKVADVHTFCPTCRSYYYDPKLKIGSQWRNAANGQTAKVKDVEKLLKKAAPKTTTAKSSGVSASSKSTTTSTTTTSSTVKSAMSKTQVTKQFKATWSTTTVTTEKTAKLVTKARGASNPKAFYYRAKTGRWHASKYAEKLGFKKGAMVKSSEVHKLCPTCRSYCWDPKGTGSHWRNMATGQWAKVDDANAFIASYATKTSAEVSRSVAALKVQLDQMRAAKWFYYSRQANGGAGGWVVNPGVPGFKAGAVVSAEKVRALAPSTKHFYFDSRMMRWRNAVNGQTMKAPMMEKMLAAQIHSVETKISLLKKYTVIKTSAATTSSSSKAATAAAVASKTTKTTSTAGKSAVVATTTTGAKSAKVPAVVKAVGTAGKKAKGKELHPLLVYGAMGTAAEMAHKDEKKTPKVPVVVAPIGDDESSSDEEEAVAVSTSKKEKKTMTSWEIQVVNLETMLKELRSCKSVDQSKVTKIETELSMYRSCAKYTYDKKAKKWLLVASGSSVSESDVVGACPLARKEYFDALGCKCWRSASSPYSRVTVWTRVQKIETKVTHLVTHSYKTVKVEKKATTSTTHKAELSAEERKLRTLKAQAKLNDAVSKLRVQIEAMKNTKGVKKTTMAKMNSRLELLEMSTRFSYDYERKVWIAQAGSGYEVGSIVKENEVVGKCQTCTSIYLDTLHCGCWRTRDSNKKLSESQMWKQFGFRIRTLQVWIEGAQSEAKKHIEQEQASPSCTQVCSTRLEKKLVKVQTVHTYSLQQHKKIEVITKGVTAEETPHVEVGEEPLAGDDDDSSSDIDEADKTVIVKSTTKTSTKKSTKQSTKQSETPNDPADFSAYVIERTSSMKKTKYENEICALYYKKSGKFSFKGGCKFTRLCTEFPASESPLRREYRCKKAGWKSKKSVESSSCSKSKVAMCGKDGKTYTSECALAKASAEKDCDGACPCRTKKQFCPFDDKPVCGTDGETYRNACFFKYTELKKACDGVCPCGDDGDDESVDDEKNDPNEVCPMNYKPVCAKDGVTYPNKCRMRFAMQKTMHTGACTKKDTKKVQKKIEHKIHHIENKYSINVVHTKAEEKKVRVEKTEEQKKAEEVSHVLRETKKLKKTLYKNEICAVFYKNTGKYVFQGGCKLARECTEFPARESKLRREFRCKNSDWVPADDQKDDPNEVCAGNYKPVCGKDGKTYNNKCRLSYAKTKKAYDGVCKKQQEKVEKKGKLGDVCASSIKSGSGYRKKLKCEKKLRCARSTDTASYAEWTCQKKEFKDVKTTVVTEVRKAEQICSEKFKPVCGKDKITYSSKCMLDAAGQKLAHKGKCAKKTETKSKKEKKEKLAEADEKCGWQTTLIGKVHHTAKCAKGLTCQRHSSWYKPGKLEHRCVDEAAAKAKREADEAARKAEAEKKKADAAAKRAMEQANKCARLEAEQKTVELQKQMEKLKKEKAAAEAELKKAKKAAQEAKKKQQDEAHNAAKAAEERERKAKAAAEKAAKKAAAEAEAKKKAEAEKKAAEKKKVAEEAQRKKIEAAKRAREIDMEVNRRLAVIVAEKNEMRKHITKVTRTIVIHKHTKTHTHSHTHEKDGEIVKSNKGSSTSTTVTRTEHVATISTAQIKHSKKQSTYFRTQMSSLDKEIKKVAKTAELREDKEFQEIKSQVHDYRHAMYFRFESKTGFWYANPELGYTGKTEEDGRVATDVVEKQCKTCFQYYYAPACGCWYNYATQQRTAFTVVEELVRRLKELAQRALARVRVALETASSKTAEKKITYEVKELQKFQPRCKCSMKAAENDKFSTIVTASSSSSASSSSAASAALVAEAKQAKRVVSVPGVTGESDRTRMRWALWKNTVTSMSAQVRAYLDTQLLERDTYQQLGWLRRSSKKEGVKPEFELKFNPNKSHSKKMQAEYKQWYDEQKLKYERELALWKTGKLVWRAPNKKWSFDEASTLIAELRAFERKNAKCTCMSKSSTAASAAASLVAESKTYATAYFHGKCPHGMKRTKHGKCHVNVHLQKRALACACEAARAKYIEWVKKADAFLVTSAEKINKQKL